MSFIREYYFDEYYRVIVVRDGEKYVVSVDVYRPNWVFSDHREICAENTCLLFKELDNRVMGVSGVEKTIIIGAKTGNRVETINVKWIIDHEPSEEEIREMYKYSWSIVSG